MSNSLAKVHPELVSGWSVIKGTKAVAATVV